MPKNCKFPVYEIEHWVGFNEMTLVVQMAVNTVDTHIIRHCDFIYHAVHSVFCHHYTDVNSSYNKFLNTF